VEIDCPRVFLWRSRTDGEGEVSRGEEFGPGFKKELDINHQDLINQEN
jgi:hypothetical protein